MPRDVNNLRYELIRKDRELFSSLLKHIVHSALEEDPTDFVLSSIGRNVGADRCYVYRFWDLGKSSMCTNTHEWCAEGIKPEIEGQQACNLADLVEFNAHITSGRDFIFTNIDDIDDGSREWLEPQGIKSLIATPLVGANNTICGFAGFDFVKAPCSEMTTRVIANIHEAADLLFICQSRAGTYHNLTVALNIAHLKGEVVEFMYRNHDFGKIREFIGRKVCDITGAQHFMFCTDDGSRADWFSEDAPTCCHNCVKKATGFGKLLPADFFDENESVIVRDGDPRPDMNLPHYCPMRSSVISQFRRGDGWWRLVADYTKPHSHNLDEVARGLRTALELLSISYNREQHEKAIAKLQEHQKFRADALAYALSKDDTHGLMDLMMHRLLDLTSCDYIAIHSVEGDHLQLLSGGCTEKSPDRCTSCPFYHLHLPPGENAEHFLEIGDTRRQAVSPMPPDCPAVSLGISVVYCDGKPWGGIALHYLNKQHKISDDDRQTLDIAANVLSLALERHSAAVRLKAERDRVIEADKARSYFFSAVSHDIRTPLNAIIGFSELLESGEVPPEEAKQDLKMIVESGKTLLQLVNDILDLSKMDVGKLEFSLEASDVGELVREIVPVFQPMATANKQNLVVDIPEMPRLMVDSHRFRQVLFNFVSNAVKYAGPCTIRISPSYANGLFKITVADDGRGVSPEKAKRLMQPFVQADIKNRTEGSGLGLSICKSLVELAHGKILIDTAPGKGFAVHVEVPVEVAPDSARGKDAAAPEAAAHASAAAPASKRILVVDDSPVNRMVMRAMLKKLGITNIVLAEDGKDALAKIEKGPAFDLVLTDLWMPVMDGNELVKAIRADKRIASLKVCAITADVEVRSTYKDIGFDMILLKPVTLDKMSDLFNEIA